MTKSENPDCPLCDNKLVRVSIEELPATGNEIQYFACRTIIQKETSKQSELICGGRSSKLRNSI